MAGGAAFGAPMGVMLESFIGWQALFLGGALLAAGVLALLLPYKALLGGRPAMRRMSFRGVLTGYRGLLGTGRGLRTYGYVLWNGIFHSGVFTWLGLYFSRRYGLSEVGIGLAILGYGIPGFLLGPIIGRAADRWGRRWLVPAGVGIGAAASTALILDLPLFGATLAVIVLSLGYDMTQPLLAGIVTTLGGRERAGQAMGLNVFTLFTGFGIGSYLFGEALRMGFTPALGLFSAIQVAAALAALPLFRSETRFYEDGVTGETLDRSPGR